MFPSVFNIFLFVPVFNIERLDLMDYSWVRTADPWLDETMLPFPVKGAAPNEIPLVFAIYCMLDVRGTLLRPLV